jgi:hypothetical protein
MHCEIMKERSKEERALEKTGLSKHFRRQDGEAGSRQE